MSTSRERRPSKRLVIALAAAVILVSAGTSLGVGIDLLTQQTRFHANVPDDPHRLGPLVQITSGDSWALIAWRSSAGVCLDFAVPNNAPYVCGFPVQGAKPATDTSGSGPPTHAIAGFVAGGGLSGGDGKTTIFGVTTPEVASVEVELRNGAVLKAPLYDAPSELKSDLKFFIIRPQLLRPHQPALNPKGGLPAGQDPVRAYSAFDREGKLIERVES